MGMEGLERKTERWYERWRRGWLGSPLGIGGGEKRGECWNQFDLARCSFCEAVGVISGTSKINVSYFVAHLSEWLFASPVSI